MRLPRMGKAWGLALSALAVLPSGCDITSPTDEWDRMRREMDRNRSVWESQEVQSYSYVMSKICECIPFFEGPSTVFVEAGVIKGVEKVASGEMVAEGVWNWWETMDELFDLVSGAIDERAAFLEVDYDPVWGFPIRIELDMWDRTVDDEMLATVSGFVIEAS